MSNSQIPQHKLMAEGKPVSDTDDKIETAFKNGPSHGKIVRGELGEEERGVKKPVHYDPVKMPTQSVPDHGKHK